MWRHHGIVEKSLRLGGDGDGDDGPSIDVSDPSDLPGAAPSPA